MRPTTMRTYPATRTPHPSQTPVCAWCGIDIKPRPSTNGPTCRDCMHLEHQFGGRR